MPSKEAKILDRSYAISIWPLKDPNAAKAEALVGEVGDVTIHLLSPGGIDLVLADDGSTPLGIIYAEGCVRLVEMREHFGRKIAVRHLADLQSYPETAFETKRPASLVEVDTESRKHRDLGMAVILPLPRYAFAK